MPHYLEERAINVQFGRASRCDTPSATLLVSNLGIVSSTQGYYEAIAQLGAHAIIPTRENAKPWKDHRPGAIASNAVLPATRLLGRKIWKKWSHYHRCSLVETKMRCFKLLGERVMARDFDRQVAELQIRGAILNRFSRLSTPTTVVMTMP